MADDTTTSHPSDRDRGADRGARSGGPREGGGFRIRLSDNEMQAARALQEAFGLRSTVAVLGFSLRTLAQQLENGELDELVARQKALGGDRPPAPRGGERRRERGEGGGRSEGGGRPARVDPFARPSRPAAPTPAAEPAAEFNAPESVDDVNTAEGTAAEAGEASVEAPPTDAETVVAEV
ncbi:hypothetical protein NZK33_00205 [Cyanobium sp. FGCU-6]|jgi:hypothetical protein|nr:hypothetical protein [Cyanobium sp. FGCU6]